MSVVSILYVILVFFSAGLVTGITSFGGNLLAIPLISLIVDAKTAIIGSTIVYFPVCVLITLIYRHHILWRQAISFGIFSLLGAPIGVWLMAIASPRALFFSTGACILIFLIWQLLSSRARAPETRVPAWTCIPFALISGIMTSTVGMGGPPMVIYAYLRKWGKENVLGGLNLAGFIFFVALIPTQWAAGFYNGTVLTIFIFGSVFSILGILAGLPVIRRVNVALFRKLMLIVLAFAAISLIIRGITG